MKRLSTFVLLLLSFTLSHAGTLLNCPDIENGGSLDGWEKTGPLSKAPYKSTLIRITRVAGANMVICKYGDNLSLYREGNFQAGPVLGVWEYINLGGLTFKQCIATRDVCSFYSDEVLKQGKNHESRFF